MHAIAHEQREDVVRNSRYEELNYHHFFAFCDGLDAQESMRVRGL